MLHLHARNPEHRAVSIDPEHFKRLLPVIKQATDAVINVSTGGSLLNTMEERIAPARTTPPFGSVYPFRIDNAVAQLHTLSLKYFRGLSTRRKP